MKSNRLAGVYPCRFPNGVALELDFRQSLSSFVRSQNPPHSDAKAFTRLIL